MASVDTLRTTPMPSSIPVSDFAASDLTECSNQSVAPTAQNNTQKALVVISTKSPTLVLLTTVQGVQTHYPEFKIVVVDSNSTNVTILHLLPVGVQVAMIQNLNWELGAWAWALWYLPPADVYMFIQDTFTPHRRAIPCNLSHILPWDAWSCHYTARFRDGGFLDRWAEVYANSELSWTMRADPSESILGAAHSSFIARRELAEIVVKMLEAPYVVKNLTKDKRDSWLAERGVGIVLGKHARQCHNICAGARQSPFFTKVHGGRDVLR